MIEALSKLHPAAQVFAVLGTATLIAFALLLLYALIVTLARPRRGPNPDDTYKGDRRWH